MTVLGCWQNHWMLAVSLGPVVAVVEQLELELELVR